MDKEDVAHIYNGILLSHNKERNWVICRDVDGPRACRTEWSKSEREKQISYINAYMWNLKKIGIVRSEENSLKLPQKIKNRPTSNLELISKIDLELIQQFHFCDKWTDKEDVVHIYNGILLSHKKEWNLVICSNVDGSRDCRTEWSKSEREKQISYINAYMWNLENGTDEPVCRAEIETDVENKHMDSKGGKRRGVVVVVVGWIGRLGLTWIHWCV